MPASTFVKLAEQGRIEASLIPTPTEEDFFWQLGVPRWPPEERTRERLQKYLRQTRK